MCPHVQTPETEVQRDRDSRGRLRSVPYGGLEESKVPPKCNRLCTVPGSGLEVSTVPPKCYRLCTVPDAWLQERTRPKCDRFGWADAGLQKSTRPNQNILCRVP